MEQCLNGEMPDRIPVSLWRHFPVDDQDPMQLAKSIIEFQQLYDFDFVKVTPASSFCIRDWGVKDIWKGNPEGTREYQDPVIKKPGDWKKLKNLNPKTGELGNQIQCLRNIKSKISCDTPVIQTIFSPMSQAKNLAGKQTLLSQVKSNPDEVLEGLKVIQETTLDYITECKKLQIDGFFYAIQFAQKKLLSETEFLTFEKPFADEILNSVADNWLNVAHIHGEDIMFDLVSDLKVQILNWHDLCTYPDLQTGKAKITGAVCGGLRQIETMVLGDPGIVAGETVSAIQRTEGTRFVLGTGCVIPTITPSGNIRAAIDTARNWRN
jgi:uroporphyrinogen decarboxylase